MAKRGGKRQGAGRKATKSALPGGPAFAERVLSRIGDLKLVGIEDAEDYALELLKAADLRLRKETFLALLYWQFGKPTQMVEPLGFDPNQPLKVIVEHIGSANSVAAKAK